LIKFLYPPAFTLAVIPFLGVGLIPAFFLWNLICVGLLLGILAVLLHIGNALTPERFAILGLASFSFLPVLTNTLQGQSGVLFCVVLGLGLAFFLRGNHRTAGLVFGLALLKPQLAVMPLILFFSLRLRKVMIGIGVALVAILAASWIIGGSEVMLEYPKTASQLLEDPFIDPFVMPNLRGSLARVSSWAGLELRTWTLNTASTGLWVLSGLLGFFLWRRNREQKQREFNLMFSQAIILGLLCSPHLYLYDVCVGLVVAFKVCARPEATPIRLRILYLLAGLHVSFFVSFLLLPGDVFAQYVFLCLLVGLLVLYWVGRMGLAGEVLGESGWGIEKIERGEVR
jgi:hypothetical protein